MRYDSVQAIKFIKNSPNIVDVDYQGMANAFKVFSSTEVLNGKVISEDIDGRIILIGYMGPKNIDKFVSPYQKKPKCKRDVFGLQYMAFIVAQVLNFDSPR
jgi:CHASE2 domain-containing sensor protein